MQNKLSFLVWLALLLAGAPHAFAQNVLFEIIELPTVNSIIREYKPEIDIVYNKNTQSSFLYVDRINMHASEVVSPIPADVTDMEIVGDTVYFCANYMGNIYYGFFDIYSTFFGFASINVYEIPFHPYDVIGGNTLYSDISLSKLEVYRSNANNIHIFMIADVIFNNPLTTDYSVIMEAYYNGAVWDVRIESEPDRVYYFNDLTVTENYLWVVGHKNRGRGEYMHGYKLINSPVIGSQMCTNPLMQYWATGDDYNFPISKPLIETLNGDSVVVAWYGKVSGVYGVTIAGYTVGCSVSLIKRAFVPNVTLTSEFRDLKYNARSKYLYLLPDHNLSSVVDMLYMFDLAAGGVEVYRSPLPSIHSLDARSSDGGAVVSGKTIDGNLGEWKLYPSNDDCVSISNLSPTINLLPPFDDRNPLNNTRVTPNVINIRHTLNGYIIGPICGEWRFFNGNNQNQQ